jgi:toxin YoeB
MKLKTQFYEEALDEYVDAPVKDFKKIKSFIKALSRGNELSQVPEPLTDNLSGWFSLKVNEKDRFVYRVVDDVLEILQCLSHYGDK